MTSKVNITDSYNKTAMERDKSKQQDWKKREREIFHATATKEGVHSLLEIGAGPGKDSLYFNEQGLETYSTDISPEMVRLCKDKGLPAGVMSFENLDFPNDQFDAVWAMNCLLHAPKNEIREVLKEIKRVLKPFGLFFMGVYGGQNSEGVWEDDFYEPKRFFSFYDDNTIQELLEEFFTIERFKVVPADVVGGSFAFQSIIVRN
ncbi:class I SAM-dependent methyltransferase [Virgibacillus flavescens]|uniref:class I SAM-dependent methyltransferase n=1 Tax=Virgibacillus flavescens TaxID=1611422 RepID=UPI003D32FC4A